MRLINSTSPIPHLVHDHLWSGSTAGSDEWKASRLRFRIIELNRAVSDASWGSRGRAESDYLHHVDLVRDGHAQVVYRNEVLDLLPGHAYFLPGNTPMERRCRKYYANDYVRFRCEWFPGIDVLAEWPDRKPVCLGRWDRKEWQRTYPDGMPLTLARHVQLQAQVANWVAGGLPDLESILGLHIQAHARFEKVFLFVEQHLGADLKVADLARAYGGGLHAFSVAFRRTMGFAAKAYVDRRLNEEVIRRLINTDASARQIASDLRFSNEYYFSRFCTRMNGLPPARFRRSLLAGSVTATSSAVARQTNRA